MPCDQHIKCSYFVFISSRFGITIVCSSMSLNGHFADIHTFAGFLIDLYGDKSFCFVLRILYGVDKSSDLSNFLLDFCFGCIFSFKESFCFCDRRLQFVSGSFRILSGSGSFGYRIQKRLCMINGSLKLFSNFAVRLYSNSNGYFLFVEFL